LTRTHNALKDIAFGKLFVRNLLFIYFPCQLKFALFSLHIISKISFHFNGFEWVSTKFEIPKRTALVRIPLITEGKPEGCVLTSLAFLPKGANFGIHKGKARKAAFHKLLPKLFAGQQVEPEKVGLGMGTSNRNLLDCISNA